MKKALYRAMRIAGYFVEAFAVFLIVTAIVLAGGLMVGAI